MPIPKLPDGYEQVTEGKLEPGDLYVAATDRWERRVSNFGKPIEPHMKVARKIKTEPEIPDGYRKLEVGEIAETGDLFRSLKSGEIIEVAIGGYTVTPIMHITRKIEQPRQRMVEKINAFPEQEGWGTW